MGIKILGNGGNLEKYTWYSLLLLSLVDLKIKTETPGGRGKR